MNKVLVSVVAIATILILSLIQACSAAQIVSVESIRVLQGQNFTMNITVDPAGTEIMGAQYHLYLDNTLLNAIEQTKGPFLSQDGANTNVYSNEINNTIGVIKYSETRTGVDYGVTTRSILATITFKAMKPGTSSLNLSEVKLSDPSAQPILDVLINNGTCIIGAAEQTPTPTPTPTPTSAPPSGSGDSGNGDASVTPTPTSTPLPSGEDNSNSNGGVPVTLTQTPEQTSTITSVPSPPPSPTIISTSPTPMASMPRSEEDNRLPGFEVAFTLLGLLAIAYLLSKRKEVKK